MRETSALLSWGVIDFMHPDEDPPEDGWAFHAMADGTNFGNPKALVQVVKSLLGDGSLAVLEGWDNRDVAIRLRLSAPWGIAGPAMAAGEAVLMGQILAEVKPSLRYVPPATDAMVCMFDVVVATLERDTSDGWDLDEEMRECRYYLLTLTCLPFVRGAESTVVPALALPPEAPVSEVVNDCSSMTGWSATELGAESLTSGVADGAVYARATFETTSGGQQVGLTLAGPIDLPARYLGVRFKTVGGRSTYVYAGHTTGESTPVLTLVEGEWTTYFFERHPDGGPVTSVGVARAQGLLSPSSAVVEVWVDEVWSTDTLATSLPGRQQARSATVAGSAPTQAAVRLFDATLDPLGTDIVVHTSRNTAWSPALRPHRVSSDVVTVDEDRVSGEFNGLFTHPMVFRIPAALLSEGTYALMALLRTVTVANELTWSARMVSATGEPIVGSSVVISGTIELDVTPDGPVADVVRRNLLLNPSPRAAGTGLTGWNATEAGGTQIVFASVVTGGIHYKATADTGTAQLSAQWNDATELPVTAGERYALVLESLDVTTMPGIDGVLRLALLWFDSSGTPVAPTAFGVALDVGTFAEGDPGTWLIGTAPTGAVYVRATLIYNATDTTGSATPLEWTSGRWMLEPLGRPAATNPAAAVNLVTAPTLEHCTPGDPAGGGDGYTDGTGWVEHVGGAAGAVVWANTADWTATGRPGGRSRRHTITSKGSGPTLPGTIYQGFVGSYILPVGEPGYACAPGDVFGVSVAVNVLAAGPVGDPGVWLEMVWYFYDGDPAHTTVIRHDNSTHLLTPEAVALGERTLTMTGTCPAGANVLQVVVVAATANHATLLDFHADTALVVRLHAETDALPDWFDGDTLAAGWDGVPGYSTSRRPGRDARVPGVWFDGSTPDAGAITYSWDGAADASTSTAVEDSSYEYYELVNLAALPLPVLAVEGDQMIELTLSTSSGNTLIDDAYLFGLHDGAVTWLHDEDGILSWAEIRSPELGSARPSVYGGTDGGVGADGVCVDFMARSFGAHRFDPGLMQIFTVTTMSRTSQSEIEFYDRGHSHIEGVNEA